MVVLLLVNKGIKLVTLEITQIFILHASRTQRWPYQFVLSRYI